MSIQKSAVDKNHVLHTCHLKAPLKTKVPLDNYFNN